MCAGDGAGDGGTWVVGVAGRAADRVGAVCAGRGAGASGT